MKPIDTLDAWLLKLPLERPYRLSFGPVAELDTVLVRVIHEDGAIGWGEATLLTGYTDETIGGTWDKTCEILDSLRGTPSNGRAEGLPDLRLEAMLHALDASHPFLTTAFRTANEMAARSPLLQVAATDSRPVRVPLLGLLQGDTPERLADEAESLLAAGYTTLKVKVGFDAGRDAQTVAAAQRAVAGRALLRLDANQGYSAAAACDFVERLEPEGIELFEQPCAAGDWAAHMQVAAVAAQRGLPLMLDESIYSLHEIEQAATLGAAAFIKVKLMKFNSLTRLDAALLRIEALGLQAVLGNGVATELSCWMEACIAARRIGNAGEMNGFLKARERLFTEPLPLRDGAIELPAGYWPQIDAERVAGLALAHRSARPLAVH
ncbi:MAG: mandelate racemase [Methylibium sp.]|nr:mandelate racemase [Methylibium sp.]